MKGLIITILALSLAQPAHAQSDEDTAYEEPPWELTVDFSVLPAGVFVPPSFQIAGMTFFAHPPPDFYAYADDAFDPHIADWGPPHERSYVFPDEGVTVVLPLEVWRVELRLCLYGSDVTIEAMSSVGSSLSRQVIGAAGACENVSLRSSGLAKISVVRLTGGQYEASIAWLSAIDDPADAIDDPIDMSHSGVVQLGGSLREITIGDTRCPYTDDRNILRNLNNSREAFYLRIGGRMRIHFSDMFAAWKTSLPGTSIEPDWSYTLYGGHHIGETPAAIVRVNSAGGYFEIEAFSHGSVSITVAGCHTERLHPLYDRVSVSVPAGTPGECMWLWDEGDNLDAPCRRLN